MFKDKLKNLLKLNTYNTGEDKNKRKIENIVVFIIILIITIIAINIIWNGNKKTENEKKSNGEKVLAEDVKYIDDVSNIEVAEVSKESLEYKLENILNQIKGVGKVKVLITYSQTSETLAMYNEDISQSNTEETDNRRRE